MTKQATIAELEKGLAGYLAEVEKGHEILICKQNVPVAKISPIITRRKNSSKPGNAKDTIKILGDIIGPCIHEEDWHMLSEHRPV